MFPGIMYRPSPQYLGPIGSAVLMFIGYRQTNKQKNDRQANYIHRYIK